MSSRRATRQADRIDPSCRRLEAVAFFHHVLNLRRLMARGDRETVLLGTHVLVRRPGHQHAALAPFDLPAFALEVELVLGIRPAAGTLAERGDLFVHRSHQCLVSSLPLEPLLHTPSIRRRLAAGRLLALGSSRLAPRARAAASWRASSFASQPVETAWFRSCWSVGRSSGGRARSSPRADRPPASSRRP